MPGNMLGIMGKYKTGRDPELQSYRSNQQMRNSIKQNNSSGTTRALDNKYSRSSEVRGHSGLGVWADFLEKVGFKMSLVVA